MGPRVLYSLGPERDWEVGTLIAGSVDKQSHKSTIATYFLSLCNALNLGSEPTVDVLSVTDSIKHAVPANQVVHLDESPLLDNTNKPWCGNRFRAYEPRYAFMLNSLITALAVSTGYEVRQAVNIGAGGTGWLIVFSVSFGTLLAVYTVFWKLWGFGGGMVAPKPPMILSTNATKECFGKENAKYIVNPNNCVVFPSMKPTFAELLQLTPTGPMSVSNSLKFA